MFLEGFPYSEAWLRLCFLLLVVVVVFFCLFVCLFFAFCLFQEKAPCPVLRKCTLALVGRKLRGILSELDLASVRILSNLNNLSGKVCQE